MLQKFLTMKALCGAKGGSSGGGSGGSGGGGGSSVSPKDVNFYDYDGTCLHAYTVKQAQAMTEMPPLPEQPGLICQGWNWSLEDIKAHNRAVDVGATYTTDDGTTRIYIHLEEGRTSPMLGVCPNGTVTVDWGDGTEPDVLTGTSTSTVVWTPNHEYGKAGDYVIRLTVTGDMALMGEEGFGCGSYILRFGAGNDNRNVVYRSSILKVEVGDAVSTIGVRAFYNCGSLASVTIPRSVTRISSYAFAYCKHLEFVTIPDSVTHTSSYEFEGSNSLTSVAIPNGVSSISAYAFNNCDSLKSVIIPDSVTVISDYAFNGCVSLASVVIPKNASSIMQYAFYRCVNLKSLTILSGIFSIPHNVFYNCGSLASVTIPSSVHSFGSSVFGSCGSVRFYDFSKHTKVPTLSDKNTFNNIPADCEIRVPAALYDTWIAATNWATYASYIKAV